MTSRYGLANLDELIEKALSEAEGFEFSKFSISSSIPRVLELEQEEKWDKEGLSNALSTKTELNRELVSKFSEKSGKKFTREEPDINILFDFTNNRVEISSSSVFIYGHYRKFSRELAQTKWPCYCKNGCEKCGGTKVKHLSIEDVFSEQFLREFDATDSKFHGAGREDIDALMLGEGRPFVLELISPKRRKLNLGFLGKKVNKSAKGKVEIFNLKYENSSIVERVKKARLEKSYRALVQTSAPFSEKDLSEIPTKLTLYQKTPKRVIHRRADLVRVRKILNLECKKISEDMLEIKMSTEAGTYVKEFISGDNGRTKPSLAEFLKTDAICKELDVINVRHPFISDYW